MSHSIGGLFELLKSNSPFSVKNFALENIIKQADSCWFDMSTEKDQLVTIVTDEKSPPKTKNLAALALAKTYFNFGEFEKCIEYVLQALPVFNHTSKDQFTVTVVSRLIQSYVSSRSSEGIQELPNIETFVEQLFESWNVTCASRSLSDLIGLALEMKRIDLLKRVLETHALLKGDEVFLHECHHFAREYVSEKCFRTKVIQAISELYKNPTESKLAMPLLTCLIYIGDSDNISNWIIFLLCSDSSLDRLLAVQLSIEVFESSPGWFVDKTLEKIVHEFEDKLQKVDHSLLQTIKQALNGELTTSLHAKFLFSQNNFKIASLLKTKKSVEGKNLILHNALIIANSLIYCGTTIDEFLRTNISWVAKASHWGKFTAVASLGGIYKGSISACMKVLSSYIPRSGQKCPYQGGGSLLALGLASAPLRAHAKLTLDNHEISVKTYLLTTIESNGESPEILHGGALALGLLMSGSQDEDIYNMLYSNLLLSEAISGEACAVGLGLLMLGSGKQETLLSLLSIAREKDQKEKIIRGISMAAALIMYGQESDCLPYAYDLLADKDPWIRMGGCMTIAMGFAGICNISAMNALLRVGIQDVSDEVKRTAITCIGFLCFKDPQMAYDAVQEFSDSYNIHIRYGVAMCLGTAGSGTGHIGIVQLLWKMFNDTNEFVRQGSAIALAMVLIQKTPAEITTAEIFRESLIKKIEDRHTDICTKFGCIIAQGILDAGGQNSTIVLEKNGINLQDSLASLLVFTQYWYWFPYSLLISQCFGPTCFVGLNVSLDIPKCKLFTKSSKSTFEPVSQASHIKPQAQKSLGLVELSTTKREMELEQARDLQRASQSAETANQATGEESAIEVEKQPEPPGISADEHFLVNPCRITLSQSTLVEMDPAGHYKALKNPPSGICMIYKIGDAADDDFVENYGKPSQSDEYAPPEDFVL
ncbi:proteasome regulatory non-ATP-ase subunit 2 [Perkinsela sp. CCAP 1560/4]|nr:proteasome regulatory non-ATP-ase subunit 2 [Perkinsela sp. CCAP 1560/4]|eukprot:KNH07119.1 proteasome regulatory non-ATP-ase subunit 2 [Perkinsela sp. CCAP 1560/4]